MIASKKHSTTTPNSTDRTGSKKLAHLLWALRFTLIILATVALYKGCSNPVAAKGRNIYSVEVRIRMGNQSSIVTTVVEASTSYEAQRLAQTQARYLIKTSVVRYKKLR